MSNRKNIPFLSLRDIFELIFKYKTILILCILSVSIPVSLYSFYKYKKSPLYEAYSKILIEQKNIGTVQNINYMSRDKLFDTEVEIIYSRPVLERVLNNPELQDLIEGDINDVVKGLSVLSNPKTNILKIIFRHKEKDLVAPFVNILTDEYIRKRYIINKDIASIATSFFEQEKEDISKELAEIKGRLKNLKEESNLYSVVEQKNLYLRNVEDLNMRLNQSNTHIKVLQEKERDITSELKKGNVEIRPYLRNIPDVISKMESLLFELELRKNEKIKKFNKDDKEVQLISGQIKSVKNNLKEEKRKVLSNEVKKIELEMRDASLEKQSLMDQIDIYTKKITNIEDKKIIIEDYNQMIQELEERKTNLIKTIYRVSEGADIEQQGSISIYKIEEAITPQKPIEPRPGLYSMLGVLAGLFLGAMVISLCKFFDHSFQHNSDVSFFLELPLLTTFQNLNHSKDAPCYLWKESVDLEKSCKMVHNFIQNQMNKRIIKTIVFTGSIIREGTSTVSSNLATFLSSQGNLSVLFIDGNFEKPVLHNFFHLSNNEGLSELLQEAGNREDVIKSTKITNLHLITSGNDHKQADSRKIGAFIKEIKDDFDLIIIDCPAVLQSPDALNFCREADAVFYIIKADSTHIEVVQDAQTLLKNEGININGVILNNKKRYIPSFIYKSLYD